MGYSDLSFTWSINKLVRKIMMHTNEELIDIQNRQTWRVPMIARFKVNIVRFVVFMVYFKG